MQRHIPVVLTALSLVLLTSGSAGAQVTAKPQAPTTTPETPKRVPGLDVAALDRSANACQDFYQFACGGWLTTNPVPASEPSWSRFNELAERNRETLRSILEADAPSRPNRPPVQAKIGDYYAACMDETAIDQKGLAPLKPVLDEVAA